MGMENAPGHGSMFGVVDSMQNMTRAMAELLQFLPKEFRLADQDGCIAVHSHHRMGTQQPPDGYQRISVVDGKARWSTDAGKLPARFA